MKLPRLIEKLLFYSIMERTFNIFGVRRKPISARFLSGLHDPLIISSCGLRYRDVPAFFEGVAPSLAGYTADLERGTIEEETYAMRKPIYIFALCGLLMMVSTPASAHGGVSIEEDQCILRIGPYKMHFTGYLPVLGREQKFKNTRSAQFRV